VHFRLKRTLLVITIIKRGIASINCGIEPPTAFRLAVLKLWVQEQSFWWGLRAKLPQAPKYDYKAST